MTRGSEGDAPPGGPGVPRRQAAARNDEVSTVARYLQVAQALEQAITGGRYPLGSLIPTENDLAAEFGVSRQTVRQAIAQLRARKLLSARKGVGTRVEAAQPALGYHHSIQSLTELFRYAQETAFRVVATEWVTASGALAAKLNCRAGRRWLRLDGLREQAGGKAPLGDMTVFVEERYAGFLAAPATHATAVFAQIERRFGEPIVEVEQEIEAMLLDAATAQRLQAPAGSAALRVTRRYFGTGRRLVELSHTIHPADRFRYTMTLRRS